MKPWMMLAAVSLCLGGCLAPRALPTPSKPPAGPAAPAETAVISPPAGPGAIASPLPAGPSAGSGAPAIATPGPGATPPAGDVYAPQPPAPAAPPIPEGDAFLRRMQAEGYTLAQSGSFTDAQGGLSSAFVFTRFEFGEPVGATTFIVAFYRMEQGANRFKNSLSPSVYARHIPAYPAYYRLANWDDPDMSLLGLSALPDWGEGVYRKLNLQGFAADINANGRPEFILAGEYCPVSCVNTVLGFDVFEIQADGQGVDLAAGLPGRIRLPGLETLPLAFDAGDAYWIGDAGLIHAPYAVVWDGGGFVDAGAPAQAERIAQLQATLDGLKAGYGNQLGRGDELAAAYSLLFGYEQAGMRRQALDAFLEVTSPDHWKLPNPRLLCWLQAARARAQDEFARGVPFSLPPAVAGSFSLYPELPLDELAAPFKASGYDLSACP